MAVRYEIGPAGQPPATIYHYDLGIVTLSPRPQTQRSPAEVSSIVSAIQVFARGVLVNDPNAPLGLLEDPFDYRMQLDGQALAFRFRCAAVGGPPPHLTTEATHDLVTRVTTFEARPERAISWGSFLLFVRWPRRSMNTKNIAITTAFPLTLAGCLFGGGIDPCAEGSPLQQDAQVASDCQACWQSPCPSGETGDDEDDDGDMLTCPVGVDALCLYGDRLTELGPDAYVYEVKPRTDCDGVVSPVPCRRSWWDPSSTAMTCTVCDVYGTQAALGRGSDIGWKICPDFDGWHPALWVDQDFVPHDYWWLDLGCEGNATPIQCPKGMIGLRGGASMIDDEWTCECPTGDDADCQPGWVCEAGWVADGIHPHPTLCTTDEGGNGIAPDGPVVYGLDTWADGFDIVIDGTLRSPDVTVVMTGEALAGAWLRAGLLNDDQRFTVIEGRAGVTARLDYCGEAALCSALTLSTGDEIDLGIGSLVLDDEYIEATATVRYLDGRVGSLTVMTE